MSKQPKYDTKNLLQKVIEFQEKITNGDLDKLTTDPEVTDKLKKEIQLLKEWLADAN